MATRKEDHDRAAAGMDFDSPIREKAHQLGAALAEDGIGGLLDEIENLVPEEWREQIARFPMTAVLLGVGVGVYLGMKKGDELLAAGGTLLTSTATANVSRFMDRMSGNS